MKPFAKAIVQSACCGMPNWSSCNNQLLQFFVFFFFFDSSRFRVSGVFASHKTNPESISQRVNHLRVPLSFTGSLQPLEHHSEYPLEEPSQPLVVRNWKYYRSMVQVRTTRHTWKEEEPRGPGAGIAFVPVPAVEG